MPHDVSVVGFDDIPEAAYLIPPLTTVRQDFAAVGIRAIEILQTAIAHDTRPAPERLISPKLVVRASTPASPGRTHWMSEHDQYVVGLDYGTLSGRASRGPGSPTVPNWAWRPTTTRTP